MKKLKNDHLKVVNHRALLACGLLNVRLSRSSLQTHPQNWFEWRQSHLFEELIQTCEHVFQFSEKAIGRFLRYFYVVIQIFPWWVMEWQDWGVNSDKINGILEIWNFDQMSLSLVDSDQWFTSFLWNIQPQVNSTALRLQVETDQNKLSCW